MNLNLDILSEIYQKGTIIKPARFVRNEKLFTIAFTPHRDLLSDVNLSQPPFDPNKHDMGKVAKNPFTLEDNQLLIFGMSDEFGFRGSPAAREETLRRFEEVAQGQFQFNLKD